MVTNAANAKSGMHVILAVRLQDPSSTPLSDHSSITSAFRSCIGSHMFCDGYQDFAFLMLTHGSTLMHGGLDAHELAQLCRLQMGDE